MFYIELLFKCSFFSVICSICSGTVSRRGSPGLKASNLKIWVTNLTVSISFNITFINVCHWNIKNSHLNFKIPVTCKILKLSELTLHNFLSILAEKWWPKFFCKLLGRHLVNKTITIHIFSNISRSKGNQTVKLGQLIQYIKRNSFLQKLCRN